jgi:hypothetical protein
MAGLAPALATQVLVSGFMFGTYAKFFDVIKQTQGTIENPFLIQQSLVTSSVPSATLAGFLTGGCLSPLCSPLEALKYRAQVLGAAENRAYNVIMSKHFILRICLCKITVTVITLCCLTLLGPSFTMSRRRLPGPRRD